MNTLGLFDEAITEVYVFGLIDDAIIEVHMPKHLDYTPGILYDAIINVIRLGFYIKRSNVLSHNYEGHTSGLLDIQVIFLITQL